MITVITRKPSRALSSCELTFFERTPIDFQKALAQHEEYERFFREKGCDVVSLPAVESLPDSVFVEDTAVVLNELAVLMSPGAESRRPETALISPVLERYRIVKRIEPPALIDGGDVLTVGKTVFVGLSTRTNREGIEAFSKLVEPAGYCVIPVPVDGALHLKSGCSALDEETLLINPDVIDRKQLAGFKTINVSDKEPFAADTLRIGGKILMQFEPKMLTAALVRRNGFKIDGIDLSEFRKAEGGPSCLSLIFNT